MKFPFVKPTVVILHGWNLSGERFTPLAQSLRKFGYKVFTPDLPGFGEEKAPLQPWHVVEYARFLDTYLRTNRISKPVLIGHSFGGRVALTYAYSFPRNVSSLILSGTPGFTPVPKKRLVFFIVLAKIGGFLFSVPPLSLFEDWVRRWYYYAVGAREYFRAEGSMRQTFKNIVQDDLVVAMEALAIPCLLLWGEYDIIVPPAIAQRMKDVIPQATLKIIPEADHGAPFKQPDVFASYVDNFLQKL